MLMGSIMGNDLTVRRPGLTPLAERALDPTRLLARWEEGRAPDTLVAYRGDLAYFVRWANEQRASWEGADELPPLNPGDMVDYLFKRSQGEANEIARAYRSQMTDAGLAPATINRRLSVLRSLVGLGQELGFVPWVMKIKNVKAEAYRDTRGPAPADVLRLFEHVGAQKNRGKAVRDVAILSLIFGMGLRIKECSGLDLADLDDRAKRIAVMRKGKREKTLLSLPRESLAALRIWVRVRGSKPGPLFLRMVPGPGSRHVVGATRLSNAGFAEEMDRWGAELGLNLHPHALRHSAITAVLDASNGDARRARKFSGHAKLETLLIYDDARADVAGDMAQAIMSPMAGMIDKLTKEPVE
jgi:integrase/recombinase XerC